MEIPLEKEEIDWDDFWDDDYDWTASALRKDSIQNSQFMRPADSFHEPLDLAAGHDYFDTHDHVHGYDMVPIDLTEHEEHDLTRDDEFFKTMSEHAAADLMHLMPLKVPVGAHGD
mmetsp:Transcript_11977/g.16268  ORF Transcript_11977/g.16268 Transcript_11977/m.16268 type:complete len:115 (-) Transcript_11977:417-761(-)